MPDPYECPECGRFLIREGSFYRCYWYLAAQETDDHLCREWPRILIENLVR